MPKIHSVEQGESLFTIATLYEFSNWKTIYYHDANARLRQQRPNPHVIFPGDQVVIPDRQLREEACPTDRRHNFVAKKSKVLLRIVVKNADGDILDSCPYALEVAGRIAKGTTSGKGMIEEPVPADARNATLTLWLDEAGEGQSFCWPLEIASLDPVEYLTGVQARLNNLGYNAGSIDGIFGPKSRAAVLAFQKDYDLDPDAIPGPITQGKLKDQYGC